MQTYTEQLPAERRQGLRGRDQECGTPEQLAELARVFSWHPVICRSVIGDTYYEALREAQCAG